MFHVEQFRVSNRHADCQANLIGCGLFRKAYICAEFGVFVPLYLPAFASIARTLYSPPGRLWNDLCFIPI